MYPVDPNLCKKNCVTNSHLGEYVVDTNATESRLNGRKKEGGKREEKEKCNS